jgi:S-adenosylmethionine:tRNA ribosyltransferase-isomerase
MKPAINSKRRYEKTRLAISRDDTDDVQHSDVGHLREVFNAGDLLVINRSGTLPSSFQGRIEGTLETIEIRLASFQGRDTTDLSHWRAVSFGPGSWKMKTEDRPRPPHLRAGDKIQISPDLIAIVRKVDSRHARLFDLEFLSMDLTKALFGSGRPIQYSYLVEALEVWDQQTIFSGPPISVEPPSAAFPLNWKTVLDLKRHGVTMAPLLHGAGLSSTGDQDFDLAFPLDEYYEIPASTVELVRTAHARGHRVFALGTTVARALESAFENERNIVPRGRTTLRLSARTPVRVVDGLLTGMHEADTSHFQLMQAFSGRQAKTSRSFQSLIAQTTTYRSHEYGDLTVLLRARD